MLSAILAEALRPDTLLIMFACIVAGLIAGALPGISATMAVALLVPFTFTMDPTRGLIALGAIYMAAIYGGAFSAILINAPGTPSSIGTTFDGYPMARQGRGEQAIITATIASVTGGLIGVLFLAFLAPPLASVSLKFGPPEYFWLAVFGLTIVASLSSGSLLKGAIGALFGLLLSTVGIAPIGGDVRFTFGQPELQAGVELVVALIGFFCIPEIITMAANARRAGKVEVLTYQRRRGVFGETVRAVLAQPVNLLRSAFIGMWVGLLPGAGGSVANLVAYDAARRSSRQPERFGTGVIDGVIATESANNAVVGASMVPLFTLGIPGAPPDAVIYGVLLLHGLRPGAELFTTQGKIVYTFIVALALATLVMAPIGIWGGRLLNRLVSVLPTRYLVPGVFALTVVGSYAIRNNFFDVVIMLVLGVAGYALKRLGVHPAPVVLGLVLGPIAEEGFVQGLLMGAGLPRRWLIFFIRPISWILILLSAFSLAWPFVSAAMRRRQEAARRAEEVAM
ncbi:MAG: tripartite tricarboxylate transporter permease [Bacillota bacterium]